MNIGQSSIIANKYLLLGMGIILLFLYWTVHQVFDRNFVLIIIIWVLINLFAGLFLVENLPIDRLILVTFNILILPYVILKYMGEGFWVRFENLVYIFSKISIPLFILNNIVQELFNSMHGVFFPLTLDSYSVNIGYWSALIYVNATAETILGIVRNNGFMWEPGAFAMILIWAIIYNWSVWGNKKLYRVYVYIIALLTTFSTAGYLALILVISGYTFNRLRPFNFLILIVLNIIFYTTVYELDFMKDKIDFYTMRFQEDPTGKTGYLGQKVNRFQGGGAALIRTLKYPMGYGVISYEDRNDINYSYGTNGLGSLLEMWGIPLFIYLMYLLWKYIVRINIQKYSFITSIMFFVAFLIMFFSNPIARNLLFYLLVITATTKITPQSNSLRPYK